MTFEQEKQKLVERYKTYDINSLANVIEASYIPANANSLVSGPRRMPLHARLALAELMRRAGAK